MSNVKMVAPATPMPGECRWRCAGCGREMAYSQPISLALSAELVGVFVQHHQACEVAAERKEVASE